MAPRSSRPRPVTVTLTVTVQDTAPLRAWFANSGAAAPQRRTDALWRYAEGVLRSNADYDGIALSCRRQDGGAL